MAYAGSGCGVGDPEKVNGEAPLIAAGQYLKRLLSWGIGTATIPGRSGRRRASGASTPASARVVTALHRPSRRALNHCSVRPPFFNR